MRQIASVVLAVFPFAPSRIIAGVFRRIPGSAAPGGGTTVPSTAHMQDVYAVVLSSDHREHRRARVLREGQLSA